jgi:hypothetical protein
MKKIINDLGTAFLASFSIQQGNEQQTNCKAGAVRNHADLTKALTRLLWKMIDRRFHLYIVPIQKYKKVLEH